MKGGALEVVTTGNDAFTISKYSLYYLFHAFSHDSVNETRITLYSFIVSLVFLGVLHFIFFARFITKEEDSIEKPHSK
jgi:hypothetical protein